MKLIDIENFSKAMKDYFTDMITHHKYNVDCVDCNADLQHLLDEQPTTDDVDKVVEELKKHKDTTDLNTVDEEMVVGFTVYQGAFNDAIDKAIEIVKQGGVGTETETIRDKAVKWNNNSSKRVPYEFIDYVEGKREIGVSDDVCEWKVKSNYYVTECSHDTDVMYGLKQDFKFCPYCSKKIKVVE